MIFGIEKIQYKVFVWAVNTKPALPTTLRLYFELNQAFFYTLYLPVEGCPTNEKRRERGASNVSINQPRTLFKRSSGTRRKTSLMMNSAYVVKTFLVRNGYRCMNITSNTGLDFVSVIYFLCSIDDSLTRRISPIAISLCNYQVRVMYRCLFL